VTIVIDVANVMGSRPDGWWRDRAGAAVRLHAEVVELAAHGPLTLPPDATQPGGAQAAPQSSAEPSPAGFVMVLEGAAKAAAARLGAPAAEHRTGGDGAPRPALVAPGEVRIVLASGSGDDTIVAVARDLPGRRFVVTADRELKRRCLEAGAGLLGPGWLLGQLRPVTS
jgi:8-oxo-dGTP diphosphatase